MVAHPVGDDRADAILRPIRQKQQAGVGVADIHVVDAVAFFVRPRQFMHFNHAGKIVVNRGADNEADLRASAHHFFVNKVLWRGFANKRPVVHHLIEPTFCLLIDLRIVQVNLRRQINFGAIHAQKRQRIRGGDGSRFRRVDDVIGQRSHARRRLRRRAIRSEWSNYCHINTIGRRSNVPDSSCRSFHKNH
ncbi:hypothetical protein U14_02322 [Candidatus Moduliflexus flocculans]|uniref:Uncharacterized protein n=1 Tax=Candidatus Moduliflexus flocculans TaxID=1499966 RepID=A0A0S6VU39_9BACT|nr:hypothetical protein U14_02322 [Candidatus Moduliflexus flocculans]